MKEQDIQREVLDLLAVKARWAKAHGGALWFGKMHTGPLLRGAGTKIPNPMAGFPDIPCLYRRPGDPFARFIGFEIKVPGGKPSEAQKAMHAALEATGSIVKVVDSMDAVAAFFGEYDAKPKEMK